MLDSKVNKHRAKDTGEQGGGPVSPPFSGTKLENTKFLLVNNI